MYMFMADKPNRPSDLRRRRFRTGRSASALLALGSTLLLVLTVPGIECAARVYSPDYLARLHGLHVFSPTYGWATRKGASVVVEGKRVSINDRGHRGRELAAERRGPAIRVVVLGDSIAFGLKVSDEETFAHLLDARDNGIEAANLSVPGYGPDQELLVLLGQGLAYQPDVVLLAFCLANDLAESVLSVALYDGQTPKPRYVLVGDRLVFDAAGLQQAWPQSTLQWLNDHSHLFNRVAALGPRRQPTAGPHWRERFEGALSDEDYALDLNLALIRRMHDVCRARGIAFLVATFPDRYSFSSRPRLTERFLGALERDGIRVVDMADHFRADGSELADVALDRIGHLNPRGHARSSEILELAITRHARERAGGTPAGLPAWRSPTPPSATQQ